VFEVRRSSSGVEHHLGKMGVMGSIPIFGSEPGYPSGQRGQTVNLLTYVFVGSNPTPGTEKTIDHYVQDRVLQDRGACKNFPKRVFRINQIE
jgi:hypothetical protein